jgi:hypothetical protein
VYRKLLPIELLVKPVELIDFSGVRGNEKILLSFLRAYENKSSLKELNLVVIFRTQLL